MMQIYVYVHPEIGFYAQNEDGLKTGSWSTVHEAIGGLCDKLGVLTDAKKASTTELGVHTVEHGSFEGWGKNSTAAIGHLVSIMSRETDEFSLMIDPKCAEPGAGIA